MFLIFARETVGCTFVNRSPFKPLRTHTTTRTPPLTFQVGSGEGGPAEAMTSKRTTESRKNNEPPPDDARKFRTKLELAVKLIGC
jgi:hypothetical protein